MIYVECKADKTLIEILGVKKEEIWHCGDKGRVINKITKEKRACGMVDVDSLSPQPKKLKEFEKIKEEYGIELLVDKKGNKLVILSPCLEEWILKVAERNKINVKDYNLPREGNKFHDIVNANIEKFNKLVKELDTTKEFGVLREIITSYKLAK